MYSKFRPVADLNLDLVVAHLENDLDEVSLFALFVKVIMDVVDGIHLEIFHSLGVVIPVVEIKIFKRKVYAFCVCFFRVVDKFLDAVGKSFKEVVHVQLFQKN